MTQQRFDLERTLYYQEFLRELLKAKYEDSVNVIGTLAWSFVDNCGKWYHLLLPAGLLTDYRIWQLRQYVWLARLVALMFSPHKQS